MTPLYTPDEFQKSKCSDLLPFECKNCKTTYYKRQHHIRSILSGGGDTNYCSRKCMGAGYAEPRHLFECEQCGGVAECSNGHLALRERTGLRHHFCSSSCNASYQNAHKTRGDKRSKLERWIETQLTTLYPVLEIHYNRRDAIKGELDIYIPSLKLAIELNGIFHYEPIYGEEKLNRTQTNDTRKFQACLERGIELCIIDTSKMSYFKESRCKPYLDIIINVMSQRIATMKENTPKS